MPPSRDSVYITSPMRSPTKHRGVAAPGTPDMITSSPQRPRRRASGAGGTPVSQSTPGSIKRVPQQSPTPSNAYASSSAATSMMSPPRKRGFHTRDDEEEAACGSGQGSQNTRRCLVPEDDDEEVEFTSFEVKQTTTTTENGGTITTVECKCSAVAVCPGCAVSSTFTTSKTLFSPHYNRRSSLERGTLHDDASSAASDEVQDVHRAYLGVEHSAADAAGAAVYDDVEDEDDDYEDNFDPWSFIHSVQTYHSSPGFDAPCIPQKPRASPKVTLVLDLDETLVHCGTEPMEGTDLTFTVHFEGVDYDVNVRKRPYFEEFLSTVSKWFEVIVFTASQKVYADKLLNILDPGRKYIKHRVFRDSCVSVEGNYLKDLTVLGRDLSKLLIIDNSPQAFSFQVDNGVPIESWYEDRQDRELLKLLPFLQRLATAEDVRPHIRQQYRLQDRVDQAGAKQRALMSAAARVTGAKSYV